MDSISAWDIYWVMQLDSISTAFALLSIGMLVLAVACILWNVVSKHDAEAFAILVKNMDARKAAWATRSTYAKRLASIGLPLFLITGFLPSSQTAAAMVVIPAIANNETIRKEAGDLYGLAKQGLAELVKPDAPKEIEKTK